jgi:hypothetical protein
LSKSKEIVLILKICYNKGYVFIKGTHVLFHNIREFLYIISLTIFEYKRISLYNKSYDF